MHTDPRVLTGEILVVLAFLLGFRDQVTHAIGTAGETPAPVEAVRPLYVSPPAADEALPRAATYPAVLALHPKRDPFSPLVGARAPKAGTTLEPVAPVRTTREPSVPHRMTHDETRGVAHRYVVKAGDSLWTIARSDISGSPTVHHVTVAWHAIYTANKDAIGADPSNIAVGTVLRLP